MTCAEHLREWLGSAGVSPSHDQKEGTEDKEHVGKSNLKMILRFQRDNMFQMYSKYV